MFRILKAVVEFYVKACIYGIVLMFTLVIALFIHIVRKYFR